MMRKILIVVLSLWATTGMARTPWYVGAGYGLTNYELGPAINPPGSVEIDGWESGFQLFAGYQLNESWAIEAGYIDFGESRDYDQFAFELPPGSGNFFGEGYAFDSTGIYLNGQYHVALSDVTSLDFSGGWLFGEGDAEVIVPPNTIAPGLKDSYDDNGLMLGVAFTWFTTQELFVRGTVNYFMVDYDDTIKEPWRLGVDLVWDF